MFKSKISQPYSNSKLQQHLAIGAFILLFITCGLSLFIGSKDISIVKSFLHFFGLKQDSNHLEMVMTTLRIPRTLACVLVGTCFGVSGSILQVITKNPLSEPGILGINGGAALGVVFGLTYWQIESSSSYLIFAFLGAGVGSFFVLSICFFKKEGITPIQLILVGIAVGTTFKGFTSFLLIKNQVTFDQYRYWVLGSLSGVQIELIYYATLPIFLAIFGVLWLIKPLQILQLDDDIGKNLGISPNRIRFFASILVTLLTGSAVAISGPIVFLGFLSGHMARILFRSSLSKQIFFSALLASIILMLSDVLAKTIARPYEIPVSVIIALMGTPFLIWVVKSDKKIIR